jgi:hypothetical protein
MSSILGLGKTTNEVLLDGDRVSEERKDKEVRPSRYISSSQQIFKIEPYQLK